MPTPPPPASEPIPLPPSPWVLADADMIEHTTVLLERLVHWLRSGPRAATASCGHALSLGEDDFPDQHTGGYGIDGDHDGVTSVYDPGDAIPSAAYYLKAHGAPGNLQAAIFAYNPSTQYVTDVLGWAARYAAGGAQAIAAAGSPQCEQAALGPLPPGTAGKVIAYAEAQIGKPYQWGATGPDAFDCSGLAMMAYRAAGITIPRTSQQQWAFGPRVPASQARLATSFSSPAPTGPLPHPATWVSSPARTR